MVMNKSVMFGHTLCKNTKFINLNRSLHSAVKHKYLKLLRKSSGVTDIQSQENIRHYHQGSLSNEDIRKKRISLFDREVKRQNALIVDIEKIEVAYNGVPEKCTLMMNRYLSTPFNCAQHINQLALDRSVIAEVDGEIWDMHKPLTDNCTLKFLHFKEADPYYVNKAFWRSLSLMLGSVLESSFNDDVYVQLCSFPSPKVRSGSFVYDVDLPLESWKPTKDEMRVLSSQMIRLALANHAFHRLEVDAKLALRMFEDNKYKKTQIPHIAALSKSGNTVILYRVGDFFDISRGPAICRTGLLGKCTVTAVHPIERSEGGGLLYRVQGVALPKGFHINHYSYSILEERARVLNPGRTPNLDEASEVSTDSPFQSLQEQQ